MKNAAILLFIYSICMIAFAMMWHFSLPYNGTTANYLNMVEHPNWFITNFIGYIGVVFGIFALNSYRNNINKQLNRLGRIGIVLTAMAFLFHLCLISWETFIFTTIGQTDKARFLISEGIFVKSKYSIILYSLFSFSFSIGVLLMGISLIKTHRYNLIPMLLMIFGALAYSFAVAFGGYIGLIAFFAFISGILYIGWFEYTNK